MLKKTDAEPSHVQQHWLSPYKAQEDQTSDQNHACLTAVGNKMVAGLNKSSVAVIDGLDIDWTSMRHQTTAIHVLVGMS